MRIGIDVRYLSHGLMGGVHTYVKHFVPELIRLASDDEIYLYADTKRPLELTKIPSGVTVRLLPWRGPISNIVNDLFMRRSMATDDLDVVHFPANYGFGPPGARTVITVHDAINLLPLTEIIRGHAKTPRTLAMMTYLHGMTATAVGKADLLLTVSEHARQDIARHCHVPMNRIIPIPHAPTPDLRRVTDPVVLNELRQRFALTRPFVLADALKNPAVLIKSWQLLSGSLRDQYQIVFFSRRSDVLPIVSEAVAKGWATLLVRPTREDLISLYSSAQAFIFPSWIEGFGIPILEAMTCGAPVIASDRGAIPEVVGDAGLLADAEDADTLSRHLTLVLSNSSEADQLRARGYSRASQYSWERTAKRILESYSQNLAAPPLQESSSPRKRVS